MDDTPKRNRWARFAVAKTMPITKAQKDIAKEIHEYMRGGSTPETIMESALIVGLEILHDKHVPKVTSVSFTIENDVLKKIEELAKAQHVSVADFIHGQMVVVTKEIEVRK